MLSRFVNAKNDKDIIAAWKSDLNRILHVFNVRSVTSVRPLLIVCFQTELAINTNVVVSGIRHDVASTHNIVSDVHRTVVKIQEGIDGKNLVVSATSALFTTQSTLTVTQTQTRSAISATNESSISYSL